MLDQYKKKANIGIVLGLLIPLIGFIPIRPPFLPICILVGYIVFIWGCGCYARSKGHASAWGLLGLWWLIGLIILFLFPDKHKTTNKRQTQLDTSNDKKPKAEQKQ